MGKPWHPCDDCLDRLADALQRFERCSVRELPKRLENLTTRWSTEITDAVPRYAGQSGIVVCRGWLELHVSVDYANVFADRVENFLQHLRDWEREAHRTPLDYSEDGEGGKGRIAVHLRERFDGICDEATMLANYVKQMSAMLRPKVRIGPASASKARDTPEVPPHGVSGAPADREVRMITVKEATSRLLSADRSVTKPKHAMRLVSGAATEGRIRSNGLKGKGKRLLVEESFQAWLLRRVKPQPATK